MIRLVGSALLAALGTTLTGCSEDPDPVAGVSLNATLVSPIDVALDWSGLPPDATSSIVEFATEPEGRYTILDFVSADQHTYRHPDLMPKTPFYYRVTPVLGPVSAAVEVRLPAATIFRGAASVSPEAPGEVAVKSVGGDGVRVSWTDNTTDEEGFLLEIRPAGGTQYRVAGSIDPNSTFVELDTQPAERTASYRVRAFHRGTPSNLAHQTTGDATP